MKDNDGSLNRLLYRALLATLLRVYSLSKAGGIRNFP